MNYAKTGYIHVLITEGKLFLNYSAGLVLTLMDDYGSNCFFYEVNFRPSILRKGVF